MVDAEARWRYVKVLPPSQNRFDGDRVCLADVCMLYGRHRTALAYPPPFPMVPRFPTPSGRTRFKMGGGVELGDGIQGRTGSSTRFAAQDHGCGGPSIRGRLMYSTCIPVFFV